MGVSRRGASHIYYMDFWYIDEKGNRKREYSSCKTTIEHEARLREAQRREELKSKVFKAQLPSLPSLEEALERIYEETWSTQADGEKPYSRVLSLIEDLGNVNLEEIDQSYLAKVKAHLKAKKLTQATCNRYMAHIKTIMRRASGQWGYTVKVPHFEILTEKNGRLKVYSQDEEKAILGYFKAQNKADMSDLVTVLLDTGMRLSEALSVTWKDNIDLHEEVIHLFPEQTKSSKPRSIPMTRRVKEILTTRQGRGKDLVFHGLNIDKVESHWKWMKKHLEYGSEYVIHALRHTCASRLVQRGVDLYTVAKILGHSSIKVTERYSHLALGGVRKAMKVLEAC